MIPLIVTAALGGAFLSHSTETLDSLYSHYSAPGTELLRENYPYDTDYRADYLGTDDGSRGNPYSYLWPYSGTLSAAKTLLQATGDSAYVRLIDSRVLPGIDRYRDTLHRPEGYASYINTAAPSDRFYDDNVWLGIDLAELYMLTCRQDYLDRAERIWQFVSSGMDAELGGGIYWCEQRKESKNTCSNAPGAVLALSLYAATGLPEYLRQGRELYDWTRRQLRDPEDGLYFDNRRLDGQLGRAKFSYNSGQILQAAVMLYRMTCDPQYLQQAREIAAAAVRRFFDGGTAPGDSFPLLGRGNVWFQAVMMRGFYELWLADGNPEYMLLFVRNLDHAWHRMRDPATGLFGEDWSGADPQAKKWLLNQAAMVELYALAAKFLSRQ